MSAVLALGLLVTAPATLVLGCAERPGKKKAEDKSDKSDKDTRKSPIRKLKSDKTDPPPEKKSE